MAEWDYARDSDLRAEPLLLLWSTSLRLGGQADK